MDNAITWKELSLLFEIYQSGFLKVKDSSFSFVQHLERLGYLVIENKNIIAKEDYKAYFEQKYLESYQFVNRFAKDNNIIDFIRDFSLFDILIIAKIQREKEYTCTLTRKQLCARYFTNRDEKYIKAGSNLDKVIKILLSIDEFSEDKKEQQFLSILHARNTPEKIVLCENKDRLISPRHATIEFWYAGGKNIDKLNYVPAIHFPMFYLCDWDREGLLNFLNIKKIKQFGDIELIIPKNYRVIAKSIEQTAHKSRWGNFDILPFENDASVVIKHLIDNDLWITEQTIDL